jgi:hypothetical protein
MDGGGRQPGQNGKDKQDDGAKHHNLSGLGWIMACVLAGNKYWKCDAGNRQMPRRRRKDYENFRG